MAKNSGELLTTHSIGKHQNPLQIDALIIDNTLSGDRKNWPTRLILTSQLYVHQAKLTIQTCLHTVCKVYLSNPPNTTFKFKKLITEQCYNT